MSVPQQTLPLGPGEPLGDSRPGRASRWWRRPGLRELVLPVVALAVCGVAVGLLWRAGAPLVQRASDGPESVIAGEVAMAGVGLLAGLATAIIGLVRGGPSPTPRFLSSLVGSCLGSVIAWGVGRLIGAPPIAATGVLLVWPLTVATVTVLVTLVVTLVAPDRP
jgi:hypothetical protein